MKIVADENMALLPVCFGWAGEVVALPGRAIDRAAVRDADALLVRSVTRVDAALLADSRCRFVGTATSGRDHIDTAFLAGAGIEFGWARGCNANAVVDYCFAVLATLAQETGRDWHEASFGIIGCGAIGSRFARRLLALGLPVAIYDPLLAASHPLAAWFHPLEQVLGQSVLSLHTPLTRSGLHPTAALLAAERLAALSPDTLLINAARGAVVDNAALVALLRRQPQRRVVLDAWEGEPCIDPDLRDRVWLGTPHIAGYSIEGKENGTRMLVPAFCACFDLPEPAIPALAAARTMLAPPPGLSPRQQVDAVILQAYAPRADDARLRDMPDSEDRGQYFDQLRRSYPLRREFSAARIDSAALAPATATMLQHVGFAT